MKVIINEIISVALLQYMLHTEGMRFFRLINDKSKEVKWITNVATNILKKYEIAFKRILGGKNHG